MSRGVYSIAISIFTITDTVDRDGIGGLVEQNPVISDAEPKQSVKLATQRLTRPSPVSA